MEIFSDPERNRLKIFLSDLKWEGGLAQTISNNNVLAMDERGTHEVA